MITSHANPRVKAARALRERKARQENGLFLAEGIRLAAELLEAEAEVETLFWSSSLLTSGFARDLVEKAGKKGIPTEEVSAEVFQSLAAREHPQGIALVVRQRWTRLDELCSEPGKPWVALEEPADPGNIGTILRTADGAGGAGLILIGNSADPYDPAAVRASMGAVAVLPIVRCGLEDFLHWTEQSGTPVVGAADSAETDFHAYRYPAEMALLLGSERQGLSSQAWGACTARVAIPMLGKADSLNLAAAAAVLLYEILNQRREMR